MGDELSPWWWVITIIVSAMAGLLGLHLQTRRDLGAHKLFAARNYVTHDQLRDHHEQVLTELGKIREELLENRKRLDRLVERLPDIVVGRQ